MSISFYALTAGGELVVHSHGDDTPEDNARIAAGIPFAPNCANGNAPGVLEALGLPLGEDGDHYGDVTAEDFLGRVLLALAITPADPGIPATSRDISDGFGDQPILTAGGRWHDMGRRPGYLQAKLGELHELAAWAAPQGLRIAWA